MRPTNCRHSLESGDDLYLPSLENRPGTMETGEGDEIQKSSLFEKHPAQWYRSLAYKNFSESRQKCAIIIEPIWRK